VRKGQRLESRGGFGEKIGAGVQGRSSKDTRLIGKKGKSVPTLTKPKGDWSLEESSAPGKKMRMQKKR